MEKKRSLLRAALKSAAGFVFPPACRACDGYLADTSTPFCEKCWASLRPDTAAPENVFCLFQFDAALQGMVHALKYEGATAVGEKLGRLMHERLPPNFIAGCNLVIPAPLHAARRRERGYNQAEILARAFCKSSGLPMDARALRRVRQTKTQTLLDKEKRRRNIRGAFAARRRLEGKSILFIDDVMTTGATSEECVRVLKEAGAKEVKVLAVGRVA